MNGILSEPIVPIRGIRQGDPLSPYLFILCQEWLSLRLRKLQDEKLVQGLRIARDAPVINHLLFADDCMLFVKAELGQLANLKKVLSDYERFAGQRVNYDKSEITGSSNMDDHLLKVLGDYLNMTI